MAGAQQIGTGAVVLTANADQMLTGLDKAQKVVEKWATNTTAKAASAGGASGGGLLKALLFGGAIGAGIGAALSGLRAVQAAVMGISNVGERSKKYSNVGLDQQSQIDRADRAFFRISAVADEFLFKIIGNLAPAIERLADVLEKVGFVGGEAFIKIAEGAGAVNAPAVETFDVLRGIGKVFTYIENAAGLMAVGVLLAFAHVMDGAALLQDAFGFTDMAAGAKGFAKEIRGVADVMTEDMARAVVGFDKAFDKIEKNFKTTDRLAKAFGQTLSGAFGQGSPEAYKVMAQFNAGNMITGQAASADNPVVVARQQLAVARDVRKATWRWVDALGKMQVITPTDL